MSVNHPPKRARKPTKEEQRRPVSLMLRLLAALTLFAFCFAAKVCFPERTRHWRQELGTVLGSQTDLQASFRRLGTELEERRAVLQAVGDWCVEVFGAQELSAPVTEPGEEPLDSAASAEAAQRPADAAP